MQVRFVRACAGQSTTFCVQVLLVLSRRRDLFAIDGVPLICTMFIAEIIAPQKYVPIVKWCVGCPLISPVKSTRVETAALTDQCTVILNRPFFGVCQERACVGVSVFLHPRVKSIIFMVVECCVKSLT